MKPVFALLMVASLSATLAACSRSSNVTTSSSSVAPAASAGAVVVAAGTTFRGKLQQEISSKTDRDGDRFSIVGNGETIDGHLVNVHPAGLGKKPAMTIVFDNVRTSDGTTAEPVDVTIENIGEFGAKSHHWRTIGMVMAGGIAGHMVAHKHHGGLAGAAGAYMLSQEMKTDIDVKPGTTIVLKFNKDADAVTNG
jgi:hypothetical protein